MNYEVIIKSDSLNKARRKKLTMLLLNIGYNVYYPEDKSLALTAPEDDVQKIEFERIKPT